MKYVMVALALLSFFLVYKKYLPAPPPPQVEAPPQPPILSEPESLITPSEQARIVKATEDLDPSVRWEAVLLLDKMRSPHAIPIVFRMLRKDLDSGIRIRAIEFLSNRSGPDVDGALIGALKDLEPEVRMAALRAIDKVGIYSAAGAISAGPVKDQEESVRLQALRVLNSLQDKRQAEIDAARSRYEKERAAASAAPAK